MSDFENISWDALEQQQYGGLDGQEYHPSPYSIPDTKTGWDEDGNYHIQQNSRVPDLYGEDEHYYEAQKPYRWALWLNYAVNEYCSTFDYTVGAVERGDIARDIINDKLEQNGLTPDEAQTCIQYWYRVYGQGVQ